MASHRIRAAAVAGVMAWVLAGCGGSGSTTTSSAPPSSTTSTQSSATQSTQASITTSAGTNTAASTTSGATTTSSGPPPCTAADLALSFLGGQGATGHGELGYALRNTQDTSCNTIGYPGIQFESKSGSPLPTKPIHTTTDFFGHTTLHKLIVDPGQTVSFRLGVTHGAASTARCATAYGLAVIAPNDTATLRTSMPGGAFECETATVSPIQPGTSAYR